MSELESVKCESCGGHEVLPFAEIEGWKIVRCTTCNLKYLNPRPTPAALARLYTEQYFDLCAYSFEDPQKNCAQFYPLIKQLEKYIGRKGRLLDIGCGRGYVVAAAHNCGWDATGLDISAEAVEYARTTLGVNAIQATPESWQPPSTFDFIVALHSIEHMPHPLAVLRRARTWLSDDGAILVRVPNIDSTDRLWHGSTWSAWQPPFHLWHFGPKTLSQLLIQAGFGRVRVEKRLFDPFFHLHLALDIGQLRGDQRGYHYSSYASSPRTVKGLLRASSFLFRVGARGLRLKTVMSDQVMQAWAVGR